MASRLQTPERGTDLYERDYYAWTQAQAVALRRLRQQEAETALDLAHLAEEVEDLGRSERDAVRSQVRRIIEHLLKLEYAQAPEPRDGWKDTVADARAVLDDKRSASLRDLEAVWPRLYAQVRPKVGRALRRFDEPDAPAALPADCPHDLDDVCRPEWYPANRRCIAKGDTP
jgi:Domain of unknown function DUF29